VADRGLCTKLQTDRVAYLADACADPRAVVVKLAHAVVAHGAVGAAGGPVVAAGGAPLGVDRVPVHLVFFGEPLLPANHKSLRAQGYKVD